MTQERLGRGGRPGRRRACALVAALLLAIGAAGCGERVSDPAGALDETGSAGATATAPPVEGGSLATPEAAQPTAPGAATVPSSPAPGATAPPTTAPACPAPPPAARESLPPAAAQGLAAALADPRLALARYGISVWADGYGEIVQRDADALLVPASNQKLWTVAGLQRLLPADFAFTTEVRITGTLRGGVVDGDLVVVAGGDTTLTSTGPHSLASMAAAMRMQGITAVTGRLVVDETRYDTTRLAPGWDPAQFAYIGPQSAFVVDWNGARKDGAYLADPARGNGEAFAAQLAKAGVAIAGGVAVGTAPTGATPILTVRSEPLPQLIGRMLGESDNMLAESLVREVGRRAGAATTAAGTAAIARAVADELCIPITGVNADGSGISRADRQSAGTLRRLLQAQDATPAASTYRAGLAEAGHRGTLERRLTGPVTNRRVWAKTGTLEGTRALSGYATTPSGRAVVFAVLANGEDRSLDNAVIDDLLTRVLTAIG